ncbi:hypothetical protein [Thalassovita sp.]|uniref:hypothetical protein n=1 Tax=Thalassovita sp. TaxID=1979401 RepID=UPI0029DE875D|nr:hypothetical protein [Thalassovita sp.]
MKVIYCAYGGQIYADQLRQSVHSLRGQHPEARIIVHTVPAFAPMIRDLPVEIVLNDAVAHAGDWHDPLMKVRAIMAEAEKEEAFVYLDNDTYIAGPLSGAWRLLARFDCMGVQSPVSDQRAFLGLTPAPGLARPAGDVFPEWNGGVLFFAGTEAARQIAHRWLQVLKMGIPGGGDQWPLAQALWESEARLHVLGPVWNCRLPASPVIYGKAVILHADHADLCQTAARLNADTGLRRVVVTDGGFDAVPLARDGRRVF